MDERRSFERDSAARQRITGELSARQVLVLIAVTAFISFTAPMVHLDTVARSVVIVGGMVVLGIVSRMLLKRVNLCRPR
jgi:hypothetical protein